ncbi:MAG: SCO family protein [Fimbriimonadaceae bacterium]|nr:SCO family protein [Alphaproteobacteria bacterium]
MISRLVSFRRAGTFFLAALICLLTISAFTAAQRALAAAAINPQYDPDTALAYSRSVIGKPLGAFTFLDVNGNERSLESFRGKPLLINLIYTSCFHACPVVVQTLDRAVSVASRTFGSDAYNIVSIGFDTDVDTPERMRSFAAAQGISHDNWWFLSADKETVYRLAEQVGFIFFPSTKGFDHLAQTTLIDAEGIVYYQVYGSQFDSPILVEPMKDLIFGRAGNFTSVDGLVNRLLLFCTIYDTSSGTYKFDYSIFIGAAIGLFSLFGIAVFLARNWRRQPPGRI